MLQNQSPKCAKIMNPKNTRTTSCLRALALGLLLTTSAMAHAKNDSASTATEYVDSVHSWGSWELGLEPAAGGPIALPENAVSNRPADVRFRPNDNRVYSVGTPGLITATPNPSPAPTRVVPTSGPGTAPPGGPGDRF